MSQCGRNKHEDICESLELFAREVMPEFQDRAEASEKEKGLSAGADAFLSKKDCVSGRLLSEVAAVIAKRKASSES